LLDDDGMKKKGIYHQNRAISSFIYK
jgi:hypothetical protein